MHVTKSTQQYSNNNWTSQCGTQMRTDICVAMCNWHFLFKFKFYFISLLLFSFFFFLSIKCVQVVQPICRLRLLRIMIGSVPAAVPTQPVQTIAIAVKASIGHWQVQQQQRQVALQLSSNRHRNQFWEWNWHVRHCRSYRHQQFVFITVIRVDEIFAFFRPMSSV